jgi:predicted protein tyrosine phosphatase
MDITHYINTISTPTIEGIISRKEIIELLKRDLINQKESLVLISISEPGQNTQLTDSQVSGFKDSIRVEFWDIEEDFGNYKTISPEVAKTIQDFIIKHKKERFLIHCAAGQSRSAGVGKAVECITKFGIGDEGKYNYKTCFSSEIDNNRRYSPNLTVFDAIVQDFRQ